jgi:hypothetical protein
LFGKVVIIEKQVHPLISTGFYIRVAEERTEIVKWISEAHPLKIDEEGFPITDHHILGLKIPVDETAFCPDETIRQTRKLSFEFMFDGRFKPDPADTSDKMVSEVIPLPAIEVRAKAFHEPHTCKREVLLGEAMEFVNDGKCFLIKSPSSFPGSFPKRPEIRIPEVFHDDETADWVVPDQPGRRDIDVTEKCRNAGVISVLDTVRIVMDQDG